MGRDRVAELRRSARVQGRERGAAHARRARGHAAAARGPLRGGSRRDQRGDPSGARLARRRPPLPAARPLGRGAGRAALSRRLGDVDGAPHPQRRAPRAPGRRARLEARPAGHGGPPLHPDRARLEQQRAAAALGPAPLRPLPALGLADRGRRPVLRRPGPALPPRGDAADARGQAALVPAFGPRRDDPRRHDLRPARPRGRPLGDRRPRRPPGPRRPRGIDRDRLRRPPAARSSAPGAPTCATSPSAGPPSPSRSSCGCPSGSVRRARRSGRGAPSRGRARRGSRRGASRAPGGRRCRAARRRPRTPSRSRRRPRARRR